MNIYLPIAEIALPLQVLFGLGLAVGIISGMFGVGGGFITTPMLIFLGVPPPVAIGTGITQVVASSVSGALGHWSRGNVDLKLGCFLISGGLMGSTFGIWLQHLMKASGQLDFYTTMIYFTVLGVVGVLMLAEASRALLRSVVKRPGAASMRRGGQHSWLLKLPLKTRFPISKLYMSTIPLVFIGGSIGILTAFGAGGGFAMVPALIYLLRVPTRMALGTTSFQTIFVACFATLMQATQSYSVDGALALPLIVGGVIGAHVGVVMAGRLNPEQLRALLGLLVLGVALRMAGGIVLKPNELFSLDTGEVRADQAKAEALPVEKAKAP